MHFKKYFLKTIGKKKKLQLTKIMFPKPIQQMVITIGKRQMQGNREHMPCSQETHICRQVPKSAARP